MNPKSEQPIELTLEKSPSGTWKVPVSPGRRLKPWQRLWIATGTIYLLMLAGSCFMLMPDRQSIERKMIFSVTEEVRRYDGMAFAGESPQKIFEIARSRGYGSWIAETRSRYRIGREGDAGFARIENNYRDAVTDLPMKRALGILFCVVAWVVPMALLYAGGFAVDWIKRGVRDIQG